MNSENVETSSWFQWTLLIVVIACCSIVFTGCGGNGGGSSGSSGSDSDSTSTSTMTFDSFEDGEYTDDWTVQKQQSDVTAAVTTKNPYDQDRSLEVNVGSSGSSDFHISHDFSETLEDGQRFSVWFYPNFSGAELVFMLKNTSGGDFARIKFQALSDNVKWETENGGGFIFSGYKTSRWYRATIVTHPNDYEIDFIVKDNFGNVWTWYGAVSGVNYDRIEYRVKDSYGHYTTFIDYASLKPYDFEPNDDSSEATELGTLDQKMAKNSLLIESFSDEDWFSFDLNTDGDANSAINTYFTHADGNLDLELYNSNNNLVDSSTTTSDDEYISLDGVLSGTYYVRVYSPSGATNNYDLELVPPADTSVPTAPSSLSGTVVSSSQIDLSWTDNSSNEDYFKVVRTNPDGITEATHVSAETTTYPSTGLSASTSYDYYVKACNSTGCSSKSNTITKTTESSTSAPTAPSNLSGTVVSSSQIDLSWTDNSSTEDYFEVVRINPDGTSSEALVDANTTTHSSMNLSIRTTYDYYVKACNSDGCSSKSNMITKTTELTWTRVSTSGPSARSGGAMAYDKSRGEIVLFGGYDINNNYKGDTWVWEGSSWTKVSSSGPSARSGGAMAYDKSRGEIVIFGGSDAFDSYLGDTWVWDGSSWTKVSSSGPSARDLHAMAYDKNRGKIVLFGGVDGNDRLGDTWEWDGSSWTKVSSSGPSARWGHKMAYDAGSGTVVLFGGSDSDGSSTGDTWEWDGNSWTKVSSSGPSARNSHAMAYDDNRGKILLFGGYASDSGYGGDTWEWDGSSWTKVSSSGPSARRAHAMAYDKSRGKTVLFGGSDGFRLGDTWER